MTARRHDRGGASGIRFGAIERYLGPAFAQIGDVHDPKWPQGYPGALELDRYRLRDYVRQRGASEGWIRFFTAAEGNIFDTNTAQVIAMEAADQPTRTFSLRGGNDQLPKAFAAALGDRVRLGSAVTGIRNRRSGVTVSYRDRFGRHQQVTAPYCVCTIPFPVLKRIELAGFDEEKRTAIEQHQLLPAGRVYFQTGTGSGDVTRWASSVGCG